MQEVEGLGAVDTMAVRHHEVFEAYQRAGFTGEQAMQLLESWIGEEFFAARDKLADGLAQLAVRWEMAAALERERTAAAAMMACATALRAALPGGFAG